MLVEELSIREPKDLNCILKDVNKKRELFIKTFLNEKDEFENVLYIHTPFCLQKCKYCHCQSKVKKSESEFKHFYNQVLPLQIMNYNQILENVRFDQIYFGGGTPTIAQANDLEKIFHMIPNFNLIKNKCMEASPSTITREHLNLLKKYDFSFLSIGIQSLSRDVCKKENRYYVSKIQLKALSNELRLMDLYFNYDMICFLDKGDIRDLQEFYLELKFILTECKPSSVTIHQYYQSFFTIERSECLIKLLRRVIEECGEYSCINSNLYDEDASEDARLQAEYRLVNKNSNVNYQHYMWNKYANMPVEGFNIMSLGFYENIATTSYTKGLFFDEQNNSLKYIKIDPFLIKNYIQIRNDKKLPLPKGFEKYI